MPTDQELILATLDSVHAKLAGLVKRADEHAESLILLRNAQAEHPPNERPVANAMRHIASRVDALPFLRSAAAQQLERLQLLHDDVRALRGDILNLRDQSSIVEANVHHLASRIDGLQTLLPPYDTPSEGRQQIVTNAATDRQQPADPIT